MHVLVHDILLEVHVVRYPVMFAHAYTITRCIKSFENMRSIASYAYIGMFYMPCYSCVEVYVGLTLKWMP